MPTEVQVCPSSPQLGQTFLLSKSEPSLFITSLALLHLGLANPSCHQAHSKNSTKAPLSAPSTATGAILELPQPTRLPGAPRPQLLGKHRVISHAIILWLVARGTWDASKAEVQVATQEDKKGLPLLHLSHQKSHWDQFTPGRGCPCGTRAPLPSGISRFPSRVCTGTSVKH